VVFAEAYGDPVLQFALPALGHTASALHFARVMNLTVKTPRVGDIAFYTFPTDGLMSQGHAGIVTDVQDWKTQGLIHAIEGETSTNSTLRYADATDGVWKRSRFATEILEFARFENLRTAPLRRKAPTLDGTKIRYLKRSDQAPEIQRALGDVFGNRVRGLRKGVWDAATSHAYAEWQRMTGHEPTGLPKDGGLAELGYLTGRFVVS